MRGGAVATDFELTPRAPERYIVLERAVSDDCPLSIKHYQALFRAARR